MPADELLPFEAAKVQQSIERNKKKRDYSEAVKYYLFLANRNAVSGKGTNKANEKTLVLDSAPALRRSDRIKKVRMYNRIKMRNVWKKI